MSATKTIFYKNRLHCANCGGKVTKEISKAGNSYIADPARPSINGGNFSPSHKCDLRADASFQDAMINAGEIITGQTVEVVKGRKVAKGTIGKIVWMGDNGWGLSYGIKLEDDSTVFTAAKNCEVYSTVKAGA